MYSHTQISEGLRLSQSNMHEGISTVVLPDLDHTGLESILQAALYFDKIYADSLTFIIESIARPKEEGRWAWAKVRPVSRLSRYEALRDLVSAEVILPWQPIKQPISLEPLSLWDFSVTLKHRIAESLGASRSLGSDTAVGLQIESARPRKIIVKDPNDLNDPDAFVVTELYLVTVLSMLCLCDSHGATPLTDHEAHANLLLELANSFPSVAKMLGMRHPSSLALRQHALAIRILEETLPPVCVRRPSDVLELREEMRTQLLSFRAEVGKLSTLIASQPWEPRFQQEVDTIVVRDVKPAFFELRRRLQDPTKRMLSHLVADWKAIATSAAVPVTALVLKGAPLPLSILAGLCSGLGIAALRSKVEEWSAKRNSALTFLVEASKKLED
jgi:hypothetical protein